MSIRTEPLARLKHDDLGPVPFSDHGRLRSAQRNLSPERIKYVMAHGVEYHRTGIIFYVLRRCDIPSEDRAISTIAQLEGAVVQVYPNGSVQTCYRNKRATRTIRKKHKSRRSSCPPVIFDLSAAERRGDSRPVSTPSASPSAASTPLDVMFEWVVEILRERGGRAPLSTLGAELKQRHQFVAHEWSDGRSLKQFLSEPPGPESVAVRSANGVDYATLGGTKVRPTTMAAD